MTRSKNETPQISWSQVLARRLERHCITEPLFDAQIAGAARAMCGAHAQVMSAAELSICLRTRQATRADVRQALWTDHHLIKTYGPRGTVHLLPIDDLPVWTGALSALPYSTTADPGGELLPSEQVDAVVGAIAEVLEDAELTTDELTEALAERLGSWIADPVMPAFQTMWPRWRIIQAVAGFRGALCFGPNRGRNVTLTNPRRWRQEFRPLDGKTALAELVRRYLFAYGPATPQQFAQWLAIPRPLAVELFDSLAGELEPVDIEGDPAWVSAGDTGIAANPPKGVRLLPYFDAYVVGGHPRERLFPGRAAERALARGQAGNFPVLLVDGIVAGVWHQKRSGRNIDITVELIEELTHEQRDELNMQVQRVGEILEGNPRLVFGAISVGSHA